MKSKLTMAVLIILSVVIVTTGCGSKAKLKGYNYMTTGRVEYEDSYYEINKCVDEDTVIIVKDDKVYKIIKDAKFVKPTEALEIPQSDKKYNIKEKKKILNMAWECTLEESGQYINYLKERGYEIEFQANTEAFIEVYMRNINTKSGDEYKRIIITPDTLMEADVKKILFKSIDNYII